MKFYRIHLIHEAGESAGYQFTTSAKDAARIRREWMANDPVAGDHTHTTTTDTINITPTRRGILRALQLYATHNDNG